MKDIKLYRKNGYTIEIDFNHEELCMVDKLKINGQEFYIFDLGLLKDVEPEKAPPCGCGNRKFILKNRAELILAPLNLPIETCHEILHVLEETLSVGFCKRCR